MINKSLRNFIVCFLFIITFLIGFYSLAIGSIKAKPGTFDHLKIEIPDKVVAGSEYKIIITAVDVFGNPVTVPDGVKDFKIVVTGSAKIKPDSFKLNEIPLSGLTVKFLDEVAEDVIFSLYEVNRVFPLFEKKIKVLPATISKLDIIMPLLASVGDIFQAKIYGKDKFGNLVCDGLNFKELNLFFYGDVSPQIREIKHLSEQCIVSVSLYSEKTGSFFAEAILLDKDIKGRSEKVKIKNADVNSFIIQAPQEAIAGEPFEISVLAVDKFGNLVEDFASKTQKVLIEAKGKGYVFPSELSSYAFTDGKVKVSIRYDKAEDIKIIVKLSHDYSKKGESEIIKVIPPKVKRFEVIAPETVIAGQKFKVKVVAYNQMNKVMSNYNLYGLPVILKTTGSGTLTPNRIPTTEFINGVAVVEVMYDKAENFEIIASVEEIPLKEVKPEEKRKEETPEKKSLKKTKKEAPAFLELQNISIIESKKKCSLSLFIPQIGTVGGYKVTTKKKGKITGVSVEIHPAKNKISSLPKFNSELIENINIKEINNKVTININLKKPVKYQTNKLRDEILIEFRKG
ncbi:MAG: hypothetical protein ABDH16_02550 [Thermodesulfovibrionaceae bacterium]